MSSHVQRMRARRNPLAACCAALFALTIPEAFATTTWTVTNCNDSGSGSLRDVIKNFAQSGDTVDVSGLATCGSVISLTTGAIIITQDSLLLEGTKSPFTTVSGYYNGSVEPDRIFTHQGSGTLTLSYLRVSYGNLTTNKNTAKVAGGCVYSKGTVFLNHSQVLGCKASDSNGGEAYGGGVYTHGNLISKYSQIIGNTVTSTGIGFGGGAFVHGTFAATGNTVRGNYSSFLAGGIDVAQGASIATSTISGNTALATAGGLYAAHNNIAGANPTLTISNSTISGNDAVNVYVGGVLSEIPTTIQNSTIAFNTSGKSKSVNSGYFASGLAIVSLSATFAVDLQSSILSNNTSGADEGDFSIGFASGATATISSNDNIIRASFGPQVPATVTTACPLLGPLRSNGGLTQTHALLSHSPAIDAGNNNANLTGDQRGAAYSRSSGLAPDIGAYEVQQADIIFSSSLEGCPILF